MKELHNWVNITDDTRVVIVTDDAQRALAISLADGLSARITNFDADTLGVLQSLRPQDLAIVAVSLDTFMGCGANRVFSPFGKPEGVAAMYAFIRLDISEKSLREGLSTPKELVNATIEELSKFPDGAALRVTNPSGTDITLRIRPFLGCANEITQAGEMAFLPPAEVSAEVLAKTANGHIVIDVTVGQLYHYGEFLGQFGLVDTPVTLLVEDGLVTDIQGCDELKQILFALPPECRELVELGHGLSTMRPMGLIGVDESIIDTCHFGIGDGSKCGVHLDVVVSNPKIIEEGRVVNMNLPIETPRLILRQFTESDAAAASYNSKQPIVAHNMSDMVLHTEEEALKWIQWINNDKFDTSIPCVMLAVVLKSSGKCIGLVGVTPKYEINNEIEISYEIADEYQGHGYGTEAAKGIIWWAFEKAGQDVLSAIIKPSNIASKRVIEKLGFVYEDTRTLPYDGADTVFDYYRLYHLDSLSDPAWDLDAPFQPEEMGTFFTARIDGYESWRFEQFKEQYERFGSYIPETEKPLRVLDIGCGSGIEFAYIWEKAPNAHITGIDLSDGMLAALAEKYAARKGQWETIKASYFDYNYPENAFDIVVSNQTMHHFLPEQKLPLYRNLLKALKPGGFYLECDFIVDDSLQKAYLARYERIMKSNAAAEIGRYHIDIPCSLETQKRLLEQAGFSPILVLEDRICEKNNLAILRAEKNA